MERSSEARYLWSKVNVGEAMADLKTPYTWWLPFPRAEGINPDLGAPLSHAAIIARALGIPLVAGCRNASMRIKTRDRVPVEGARGSVNILECSNT